MSRRSPPNSVTGLPSCVGSPAAKESRLKATTEELPDYVERVPRRFEADRRGDESFAAWTLRATEEELS